VFWLGQATWVSLVALPIYALNAIPAGLHPALNWKDFVGVAIWIAGFATEVVADRQKSQWRKEKEEKKHSEEWISSGLWGKSRHPNYFGFDLLTMLTVGESTIWVGAFIASAHALGSVPSVYSSWFGYAMVVSPAFITFLLTKVISQCHV
jgi:steroid 5-alpha reductase family enzyme